MPRCLHLPRSGRLHDWATSAAGNVRANSTVPWCPHRAHDTPRLHHRKSRPPGCATTRRAAGDVMPSPTAGARYRRLPARQRQVRIMISSVMPSCLAVGLLAVRSASRDAPSRSGDRRASRDHHQFAAASQGNASGLSSHDFCTHVRAAIHRYAGPISTMAPGYRSAPWRRHRSTYETTFMVRRPHGRVWVKVGTRRFPPHNVDLDIAGGSLRGGDDDS